MIKASEFSRACMPANFRHKGYEWAQKYDDASEAVHWLVSNAATYRIQKESIMLYGYSMGGFLANSIIWKEQAFTSKYVSAAVFSAGVGEHQVDQANTGHHPPLLAISSKDDTQVKYKYSKKFYDKLKTLGGIVHLLTYHTAGHFPAKEPSFHEQIDAFLDSPDTYEAPDTPACKDWCFSNMAEWSLKCSWNACSICDECEEATTTTRKYIELASSGWCLGPGMLFDEPGANSLHECKLLCDAEDTCMSIVLKHDGSRCVGFSNDCSERDDNGAVVPYTVQEGNR